MAIKTKEELKALFETGDKPTGQDFIDLIDTLNDNPMTTAGDLIVGGTDGAPTRLAKGTDGQVLTLASGLPSWAAASGGSLLVAETVVSSSAVTSVTFSGLDGNAAGGYVLIVTAENATTSNSDLNIWFNNDMTSGNYSSKFFYIASSTGIVATDYIIRLNEGIGETAFAITNIAMFPSGKCKCITHGSMDGTAQDHVSSKCTNSSITNLTRIDIVATVASSIAVGSTFRLYRRK